MLTHFMLHVDDDGDICLECFRNNKKFLQTEFYFATQPACEVSRANIF